MNLRVDLMLDTERRSVSVFTIRLFTRVAAFTGPVFLALVVALSILANLRQRATLRELEEHWRILESKRKAAEKLNADVARNRQLWKAIEGWPAARVNFSDYLVGLLREVPPDIQLTSLGLSHDWKPHEGKTLARFYTLRLEGRSVGTNAEENIQAFVHRLKTRPPFAGHFQSVSMRGWADTSAEASRHDRLFSVACVFRPKKFAP